MSNLWKFNPNPKGRATGDCVIRALCVALNRDWDTVYRDLCDIGFELKTMPNSKEAYGRYLLDHGFRRTPISSKKGTKRPTVNDMAILSADGGTYICEVAKHLVTAIDGRFADRWDCGTKCLYGYWQKME